MTYKDLLTEEGMEAPRDCREGKGDECGELCGLAPSRRPSDSLVRENWEATCWSVLKDFSS